MKKGLKLLLTSLLGFTLMLAGCSKPAPIPTPEVVHVTGVTSTEESFIIEVGEAHELVYTIAPENAADKSVTVASESACVSIEGTTVTGELAGYAEVLLTTIDGNFSITYNVTVVEPVLKEFPSNDIIAFYQTAELDVVVPSYAVASEEAFFEIDTSTEEYFDVYVNHTTSDELVAYKNALKADGWVVVSADEETSEDFKLQFGETNAFVDLLDYTAYADEETPASTLVSFYVKSADSYSAEKVAADINATLESAGYSFRVTWDEQYQEYGLGVNTGSSTDESQESLSQGASILASFLPEYATLVTSVYGDPTAEGYVDIFGDGSIYFRAIFATPDYAVKMDIVAYIYNGLRIAQLSVVDIGA